MAIRALLKKQDPHEPIHCIYESRSGQRLQCPCDQESLGRMAQSAESPKGPIVPDFFSPSDGESKWSPGCSSD